MISAPLDPCVLYPIGLTSRNIVEDTPRLTAEQLEITFAAMRQAFPDAMVRGYVSG